MAQLRLSDQSSFQQGNRRTALRRAVKIHGRRMSSVGNFRQPRRPYTPDIPHSKQFSLFHLKNRDSSAKNQAILLRCSSSISCFHHSIGQSSFYHFFFEKQATSQEGPFVCELFNVAFCYRNLHVVVRG